MTIVSARTELILGHDVLTKLTSFRSNYHSVLEGSIPYNIVDDQKLNLLTIRVQNNKLTAPVASSICELDVNKGQYELVELGVDCVICPDDCSICAGRCY